MSKEMMWSNPLARAVASGADDSAGRAGEHGAHGFAGGGGEAGDAAAGLHDEDAGRLKPVLRAFGPEAPLFHVCCACDPERRC